MNDAYSTIYEPLDFYDVMFVFTDAHCVLVTFNVAVRLITFLDIAELDGHKLDLLVYVVVVYLST